MRSARIPYKASYFCLSEVRRHMLNYHLLIQCVLCFKTTNILTVEVVAWCIALSYFYLI